jgi:hypothetical protein
MLLEGAASNVRMRCQVGENMRIVGRGFRSVGMRVAAGLLCGILAAPAWAGSFTLWGIDTDYKLTLGYAAAMRMEGQDPALVNGPVDTMQIDFTPAGSLPLPGSACMTPPCIGSFRHTGLPDTTNFDDGDRDFNQYALLNNRGSAYGETQIHLESLGFGNIGLVGSGAAHYDLVFEQETNDHDNPNSVNRVRIENYQRVGPHNTWLPEAEEVNGFRHRLLEAYAYGEWNFTDTIGMSLRAGRHLAAWGESLFFPGIVSAQGPFDATKANVPGVEVKEILLPVNQVSMQLALTPDLTVLAYNQFEFKPTEIYPEGDFFSPADLVGPGSNFGYGSINPVHPAHCNEPEVTDATTGQPAPPGSLCVAAGAFENQPEYIYTLRTPDAIPDAKNQYGLGVKYQLLSNLNVGGYYLKYKNHNPHVLLNMGYARVGDAAGSCNGPGGCQEVRTDAFNVRVPVSYTVAYQDDVTMQALSFSTVVWVFNVGGEIVRRQDIDTSLEATIAGVVAPYSTTGTTDQVQLSLLYVNNPGFIYDEVVVVTEMGYLTVEESTPVQNQDGVCMSGTDASDCDGPWQQSGNTLFYDKDSFAVQSLVLPKIRNAFAGWDLGTPLSFSWLISGTPSVPGTWGPLYGEGDMRIGLSVVGQYLQNLELTLGYNAFFGDPEKKIGNSSLRANPYADRDYAFFNAKYNL